MRTPSAVIKVTALCDTYSIPWDTERAPLEGETPPSPQHPAGSLLSTPRWESLCQYPAAPQSTRQAAATSGRSASQPATFKKKLVDDHRRGPYRETVWQQDDSGQCFFNSYTLLRMTASGTDPLRQYGCSIGRASSGLSLASTITSTASASFVACRTFCIIL